MDFDPCQAWYSGSPLQLNVLPSGSIITQRPDLARVHSHKPSTVSVSDNGEIKHDGKLQGYLYIVAEEVFPKDIVPHPHSTLQDGDEWLTTRDLELHLIMPTDVEISEMLTDEELSRLLRKAEKKLK